MHLRPFFNVVFNADSESVFNSFLSCLEPKKLELKVYEITGFTVLTPQLLRLLQVRNESKRNPTYESRFYSVYEKYYKNNRNTK